MINLWGPVNAKISIPNRPAFYDAGLGVYVWQPAGGPALSLDFLSGLLDNRITFSRASLATQDDGVSLVDATRALSLNFLSGTLDSRITFSRASLATYDDGVAI